MRQDSPNGVSRPVHVKDKITTLLKRAGATITAVGMLTIAALIASCGGSGGGGGSEGAGVSPAVVSGVAATGAPLAGGQVSLRDSSSARNEKVGNIDGNGAFAIDVAGMTAPFILKATGTVDGVSRTLFSFADKPGTSNINPLSTTAVANAAGVDDPAELFDKSDSATLDKIRSVTPTSLQASIANLLSKLKPLLDEFSAGNTNPISDPFAANHEGLDGMFDNVKIVIANGTLTITNVDTDAVLFTAQVKDLGQGRFTDKHEDVPKHGRPRPAAPTGVITVGGPGPDQVTVSWDPVPGATSYDLFYTTKSKAAEDEDNEGEDSKKRIKNVTSPFVVSGLDPATTYFFIIRARIDGRKGPRSAEVSGTPSSTTPSSTTTTTTTTTAATTSTTAGATTTTAPPTTTTTTAAPTTTTTAPPTTTTAPPTTTTTTTTASTTTTTLAINGAALYATNCANCHNPLATSEKRGASAAQISAGISGVSSMRNSILATNGGVPLTAAQISAIAAALQ